MEIASVVYVLGIRIHNGIVAGRVEFVLQNLLGGCEGVVDRAKDLRGATERIIRLHLLFKHGFLVLAGEEFQFPFGEAAGGGGQFPQAAGNDLLAFLAAAFIQGFGHEIVVGAGNLIHPDGGQGGPVQQAGGLELVHQGHARHHGSAVDGRKAFADMDFHGLKAAFCQHIGRRTPFTFIMDLSLSDESQGHVGQLNQVSAGAYAAVAGDKGIDAAIDKLHQKLHHIRMDAGFSLQEGAYAGHHGGFDGGVSQGLACAGGMAADNIVLEIFQILVVHSPLGHGAETGIDPVNDFILVEFLQEVVATLHLSHGFRIDG